MKSSIVILLMFLYLVFIALPTRETDKREYQREFGDNKQKINESLELANIEIIGLIIVLSVLLFLKLVGILPWWK